MSRFHRRRARALVEEAERLNRDGSRLEAVKRLQVARDLLSACQAPPMGLPPILRRIGDLAASWGDEDLSDRSYLDAHRQERRVADLKKRLSAESGLPPDARWSRLDTDRWDAGPRARAESLRSGLYPPWHHLVVRGSCAGSLVAALGWDWIARGTSVLFLTGRILAEELLRAHRELDTRTALRRYDAYKVVIVNEPEIEEEQSLRCLDLLAEDRSSRGSLVISSVDLQAGTSSAESMPPENLRKTRWLRLLQAGGDTLLLDLRELAPPLI